MELPKPGMTIDVRRTALVLTDLQNDFLSPGGIAWGMVADSLAANTTIENLESLLRAARRHGLPVFISPHYYYPTDRGWESPGGALEALMQRLGVFENLESLLRAARRHGLPVFISPHYYYPTDRGWESPGGALEALMQRLGVF